MAGAMHKGCLHREVGGGSPKGDMVKEVAWILHCISSPNVDKGEGVKNQKFCRYPLCMVPKQTLH